MIQPDPGLAQHAQERLLGAELRMVVAADIRHPARRLAQPPRLARLRREQRIGPGEQRRRQRRIAAQPRRQLVARRQQRVLGADRVGHALHEPALAQAAGAEHHPPRAGRTQHAPQHHRGIGQIVDAPARQPGQPLQRAAAGTGDHAGQVARLLAADRVVVHHLQRIAGLRHVDARQRAPRAADQIQIAIGALGQPGHRRQVGLGDGARAHRIAAGALRQPDHAEAAASATRRARRGPAAPVPASRRRYRPGCRPRSGMPHSTPSAEYSASCWPDRMRIGTPGMRDCKPATKSATVARVAHRGGGQHLERLRAHRARHGVIAVHHGEAPAPCRPRSAVRSPAGRGRDAAPPFR